MTRFAFTSHSYPNEPERWLKKPVGKYLEIFRAAMEPHEGVRQIDLCCGLGFGKTLLLIQIAAIKLDTIPGTRILFLEPDWERCESIFLDTWKEHVPPELYHHIAGRRKIIWLPTRNVLHYRARVITGSKELAKDKRRGPEYTDVFDDETAIGFDMETYTNTLARIRTAGKNLTYITATTPKVGEYGRFLKRGGNIVFRGRTADNHYLLSRQPDYEKNLRATMSPDQARRELDGELVALEGRIWYQADLENPWPQGNIDHEHPRYDPGKPWWLFCDLGSSTGAYSVIQHRDSRYRGRRIFDNDDNVWVAVADLCPSTDASAMRAFQRLKEAFGRPAGVVAGKDIDKRADTDGATIAHFVNNIFGQSTRIYSCDETIYNKMVQFDCLNYLVCSAIGERRFTIARDFVSMDDRSHRGIREMLDEDQWPSIDKRRMSDFLPKDKTNTVQHIRDSLLMGAVEIMHRPSWTYGNMSVA